MPFSKETFFKFLYFSHCHWLWFLVQKRSRYSCPSFGLAKIKYTRKTDPRCPQALWKGILNSVFSCLIVKSEFQTIKQGNFGGIAPWFCKSINNNYAILCKERGPILHWSLGKISSQMTNTCTRRYCLIDQLYRCISLSVQLILLWTCSCNKDY